MDNNSKKTNETFETQLKCLEKLVTEMSSSQADLEKALEMFEKGSQLSKNCQELLNKAEQKIKLINSN